MSYTDLKLGIVVLFIPPEEIENGVLYGYNNGDEHVDFLNSQGATLVFSSGQVSPSHDLYLFSLLADSNLNPSTQTLFLDSALFLQIFTQFVY